jgi:hypothetical protein
MSLHRQEVEFDFDGKVAIVDFNEQVGSASSTTFSIEREPRLGDNGCPGFEGGEGVGLCLVSLRIINEHEVFSEQGVEAVEDCSFVISTSLNTAQFHFGSFTSAAHLHRSIERMLEPNLAADCGIRVKQRCRGGRRGFHGAQW